MDFGFLGGGNAGGGGGSFDGQLKQNGENVSPSNPLPIKGGISDTTFQDADGQLFVFRDNGIATPLAYKIPEWEEFTPVEPVTIGKVKLVNEEFYTEDVEEDTSNNTTFVGKQTKDGVWLLQKIVDTIVGTVTTTSIQYASLLNNATKTTYASAWTDRATLTYSEIKNLL